MHKVFLPSDLQKSGGKAVIYCFADPLRRPAVYARKGLFRYPYKRILAFLIYKKARKPWFQGLWALLSGLPGAIRTRGLSLRRSPRGAFSTPYKSPKVLDFTGFSEVLLSINSRPKPANFSWFFAFLLAGY